MRRSSTSLVHGPPGLTVLLALWVVLGGSVAARTRSLADESDRAAFRSWFALLADLQFERAAAEVTDCAALVRFAYREALRPHTPEWARRVGLPITPVYPDVRSGPRPGPDGWPLFRVSEAPRPRYAEFADARTIVGLNTRARGRDIGSLQAGDLLYFRQPEQRQPDHLMIFVGRSVFDREADDWVVYHTGPSGSAQGNPLESSASAGSPRAQSRGDAAQGEVRKVRLTDVKRHPAPRWRPVPVNPQFIGVFRFALL
jgi:uncharacterized protein YfaT (DUF1175 family)